MTSIRWVSSTPSTNTAAREEPVGTAIATLNQTAGRGRLGRTWVDTAGKGLAISAVVSPGPIPTLIPLVAGAAVVAVLRPHGIDAWAKWPNDVYVAGRKVAGILTEMPGADRVVVGLGVNVRHSIEELPFDTATSLAVEGCDIDPRVIADEWLDTLKHRVTQVGDPALIDWIESMLGLRDDEVAIDFPDGHRRTGIVRGISDIGALLLDSGDPVVAGDITRLRPVDEPTK